MSKQVAIEFLERINSDMALRKKLSVLDRDDIAGLIRLAADSGYVFSPADYSFADRELAHKADQLTHDELGHVAGGYSELRALNW
jgi:predicted ribosomally synthesized peptide with nif11-like leader